MNRLLELQRRSQKATNGVARPVQDENRNPSKSIINPIGVGIKYLPIVGRVTRKESGAGIPLLPIEFEGVFSTDGNRVNTEQLIFESKTNGKGNFFMLASYKPQDENAIKGAEVHIHIAGQSEVFKMSIHDYSESGKAELKGLLDGDTSEHLFIRLGLQSEKQLTTRNQLSSIALEELSIG